MECKHCKSTWNSSQSVRNCPFCGKAILTDVSEKMTLPEGISTIVAEYGIEILNESKRLMSLVMDYVRDCDKEKKLLRIACNCGALNLIVDIISSEENQRELLIKKAIKKLEDEAFLSTSNAEYIICILLSGVGISYNEKKEDSTISSINQQTTITETSSQSIATSNSVCAYTDDVRLKNIVLSNASSSQEDRDTICEIGRKKLINQEIDEGFKYVQYAAKRGSMNGAILLGYCYDVGLGIKQDKNVAEAYYRQGTISNPEFKSFYQQHRTGRDLLDAAAQSAEKMLKTTYVPTQTPVVSKPTTVKTDVKPTVTSNTKTDSKPTETKKPEIPQTTSTNFFQSLKGKLFGSEKDKENHLWEIVNANRRPTNDESAAILNLGRKLLKNGSVTDGVKLIKFTAQYGYAYGALLLGYCYDKGLGVPKDYNVATAYYNRAGVSGSADPRYKLYGWNDMSQRSRASALAEKIYNDGV